MMYNLCNTVQYVYNHIYTVYFIHFLNTVQYVYSKIYCIQYTAYLIVKYSTVFIIYVVKTI